MPGTRETTLRVQVAVDGRCAADSSRVEDLFRDGVVIGAESGLHPNRAEVFTGPLGEGAHTVAGTADQGNLVQLGLSAQPAETS